MQSDSQMLTVGHAPTGICADWRAPKWAQDRKIPGVRGSLGIGRCLHGSLRGGDEGRQCYSPRTAQDLSWTMDRGVIL